MLDGEHMWPVVVLAVSIFVLLFCDLASSRVSVGSQSAYVGQGGTSLRNIYRRPNFKYTNSSHI